MSLFPKDYPISGSASNSVEAPEQAEELQVTLDEIRQLREERMQQQVRFEMFVTFLLIV